MRDRESYSKTIQSKRLSNLEIREKKTNAIRRKHMVKVTLDSFDVSNEKELAHLESLLDQIEPLLDTPFKG